MRIPAVVILCALDLPSPGHADCYGLHEHNALEQRDAYARDCETIRSLISCGIKERDAIAIVVDRHAMEGYMAQLIAQCETAALVCGRGGEGVIVWVIPKRGYRKSTMIGSWRFYGS